MGASLEPPATGGPHDVSTGSILARQQAVNLGHLLPVETDRYRVGYRVVHNLKPACPANRSYYRIL